MDIECGSAFAWRLRRTSVSIECESSVRGIVPGFRRVRLCLSTSHSFCFEATGPGKIDRGEAASSLAAGFLQLYAHVVRPYWDPDTAAGNAIEVKVVRPHKAFLKNNPSQRHPDEGGIY